MITSEFNIRKMYKINPVSTGKILVPTKYLRQQNIGIDKIFKSTKSRRQNVGACTEGSPYCFCPAKSAAADFSRTSLMFPYFSLNMLYSPCSVTKCAVAVGRPAFMGGLSPALYRLICTSPLCKKHYKYWR
jgi:hypothetical protein